jgi:hypothetical protein
MRGSQSLAEVGRDRPVDGSHRRRPALLLRVRKRRRDLKATTHSANGRKIQEFCTPVPVVKSGTFEAAALGVIFSHVAYRIFSYNCLVLGYSRMRKGLPLRFA